MSGDRVRRFHAAGWDEPLVMQMGAPGRRGMFFPAVEPEIAAAVGAAESLVPEAMRRTDPPQLPELAEPEVQRHYLRLSQQTLGMMGVSLFGTCTMKYNARVAEDLARRHLAEMHPLQPEDTLQGVLAVVHGFDLILRELSGMDQFVFQPGGGADAAYTHAVVTRAWLQARGELGQRDEIITSIQAHPCNAATAAAAGFKVVTLMLEEDGYPSVEALQGRRLRPHRRPDDQQPRRHGHLQPAHRGMGADRERGRRPRLLRPRQLQRRHGQDPRRRARLRRLHVHAPQDLRRAQGRRRPGRRRLWLHGRAGAVPAAPRSSCATATATASTATAR